MIGILLTQNNISTCFSIFVDTVCLHFPWVQTNQIRGRRGDRKVIQETEFQSSSWWHDQQTIRNCLSCSLQTRKIWIKNYETAFVIFSATINLYKPQYVSSQPMQCNVALERGILSCWINVFSILIKCFSFKLFCHSIFLQSIVNSY